MTIKMNGKYGAKIGNIQVFTIERAVEIYKMFVERCYSNLTMEASVALTQVEDDMRRIGFTADELEAIELSVMAA